MATIEQIKALIRAHLEADKQKFKTTVLQIAAHEAKVGHTTNAREIKDIIQNPKYINKNKVVLVISDISLGLIARTVPQIHVFILGFPLKSGLGILMLILLLPMFSSFMGYLVSQLEADFLTLMELFMP
jgi:hypothetical protein